MKNKIFHLATCKTCQKILAQLPTEQFELREIKSENITDKELDELKKIIGSYESLFSRRAMKFRSMRLHDKNLTEEDYRSLILEEYTFLKRPVIQIGEQVFAGSAKKNIESVLKIVNEEN